MYSARFYLYPMPLEVAAQQGDGLADEIIQIEQEIMVLASFLKFARTLSITATARYHQQRFA